MTIHHPTHQQRITAGVGHEWDRLPPVLTAVPEVPHDAQALRFRREGKSHRGLHAHKGLTQLWARAVNQEFLEEIAQLRGLRLLHLADVTATDLAPLAALPALEQLTINDATKVPDLAWVEPMQALRSLGLEHFKRVSDLSPLSSLTGLTGLAVEGSMWTAMRVATLQPLAALSNLEALFLTNLRVEDKSLRPLHGLARLRTLHCARFFPPAEFAALAAARPGLECSWFTD